MAQAAIKLAEMSNKERNKFFNSLSEEEAKVFFYDWENCWAREKQLSPKEDWRFWLLLSGRGFGKTRTGAEFVRKEVEEGRAKHIALIAETPGDARDVMIEGESGLLNISPPWFYPHYEPSKRRITWPNGARATIYSGYKPDQLRGPQHDLAWLDEFAAYKYPDDVWANLLFGLRLGENPRAVITTTPRPLKILKEIIQYDDTYITKGSTYENRRFLTDIFFDTIVSRYDGTTLGRQELYAEILEEVEGALWTQKLIDSTRVKENPPIIRIVVAVDPATTFNKGSDETGIIVAGIGEDGQGYVLDDFTVKDTPHRWAKKAIEAYHQYEADRIIGEANNGGDLIETVIRTIDRKVSYKKVHAARAKKTRAEPVSALYEQGKVHHVGSLPKLEDEMVTWVPTETAKSPNRIDALVWGLTDLMLKKKIPKAAPSGEVRGSTWRV